MQKYVGITKNLKLRLKRHNRGSTISTSRYTPWHVIAYVAIKDKKCALAFEKYLKSHSGRAFANKRLWES